VNPAAGVAAASQATDIDRPSRAPATGGGEANQMRQGNTLRLPHTTLGPARRDGFGGCAASQ